MTTKTAITNDKPKGATDKAVDLAVSIAYELGKQMGAKDTAPAEPVVNKRPVGGPFGFKAPKAIKEEPVTNAVKPLSRDRYILPKAEG